MTPPGDARRAHRPRSLLRRHRRATRVPVERCTLADAGHAQRHLPFARPRPPGSSEAWLSHVLWEHEIVGSNPTSPTTIRSGRQAGSPSSERTIVRCSFEQGIRGRRRPTRCDEGCQEPGGHGDPNGDRHGKPAIGDERRGPRERQPGRERRRFETSHGAALHACRGGSRLRFPPPPAIIGMVAASTSRASVPPGTYARAARHPVNHMPHTRARRTRVLSQREPNCQ
jgi:hypothetical protein